MRLQILTSCVPGGHPGIFRISNTICTVSADSSLTKSV